MSTNASNEITDMFRSMSDTKSAIAALASAFAVGALFVMVTGDVISQTPEMARSNEAAIDSIRPIVYTSAEAIVDLQNVDLKRDEQMTHIETAIEDIRLNQCLTLAEIRGDGNADRCRND